MFEVNACNSGECRRTRLGEIHPAHEPYQKETAVLLTESFGIEDFYSSSRTIDYFSDASLTSSTQDEFYHTHYVAVLKNILRRCETPINIGLYGRWGVGKTSILKMLEEELDKKQFSKNFKFLYVDAWGLSADSLKQEILVSLNEQLGTFSQTTIEDTLYNVREQQYVSINEIWQRGWPFFIGLGIITGIGLALHYNNTINFADFMPIPTAITVITAAAKFFAEQSKRIIPRAASSQQFSRLYQEMVSKENRRLVVVIDNLDRCDPSIAVDLLGLIQTFMTRQKCINILACDDEAIVNHLRKVKGDSYTYREGNEFLSKFFQVTIRIPPFIGENLENYVTRMMEQRHIPHSGDVKFILITGAIKNPRKVNQFLNNVVAMYRLAILKEKSKRIRPNVITKNIAFLTKLIVIGHEWPNFYKLLEKNNELLDDINKTLGEGDPLSVFPEDSELALNEWKNEGLKEFLNTTQFCTVPDIGPFIRLNQESYEGELEDIDAFEIAVIQGRTDYVLQKLKGTESDQEKYIKKICSINNSHAKGNATAGLLTSLKVLIKALYAIESPSIKERGLLNLGQHLLSVLKTNYEKFDLIQLFELVKQMKSTFHERIYDIFIDLTKIKDELKPEIIKELLKDNTDLPSSTLDSFDKKLSELLSQHENVILEIIQEVCSSPDWPSNKFSKPVEFVTKLIAQISFNNSEVDNKRLEVYSKIEHNLDKTEKEDLIRHLQKSVDTFLEAPPKPPPSTHVFEFIYNLDMPKYKELDFATNKLFKSLVDASIKVTDVELRKKIFEVLIKLYTINTGESHA